LSKINVLQLGTKDWSKRYQIPREVKFSFLDFYLDGEGAGFQEEEKPYDIVFLERLPEEEERDYLEKVTKPYCLYLVEGLELGSWEQSFCYRKKAQWISEAQIQTFLSEEAKFYFSHSYGEKYEPYNMAVSRFFKGSVQWNGQMNVSLSGDFGNQFKQVVFWRNNIPIEEYQVIDYWLEYEKTPGVEITFVVNYFIRGSVHDILKTETYTEKDLEDIIQIKGVDRPTTVFVSIQAKGEGELKVIALHDRYSRGAHGYFLPGGERFVTSGREEVFAYFDPGDCKPPLNIYFSGYKTREGFEGHNVMKKMGSPYLLLAEARLEGGDFYMGDEEYEELYRQVIQKYLDELGFTSKDLVMAGLSMGTYGALYYGCDFEPHAVIVGKPLVNIGDIAANEKLNRPGGFPTSLDVLMYQTGSIEPSAVLQLNQRFWEKFDQADFGETKFVVAYMYEDDYDRKAYETLLSHMNSDGVQVYGKGLHGRHNDNTGGIVQWFLGQFRNILRNDYGREIKE